MKNNSNCTPGNASFFGSIRTLILLSGLSFAFSTLPNIADAAHRSSSPGLNEHNAVQNGIMYYTLKNHEGTFTKCESLDDSCICILSSNTLSIKANTGWFSIEIMKSAALTENSSYCQNGSSCSTPDAYSLARYTWKEHQTGIDTAMTFEQGEITIVSFDPIEKLIKINFRFTLHDPRHDNKLVSVEGFATLHNIVQ